MTATTDRPSTPETPLHAPQDASQPPAGTPGGTAGLPGPHTGTHSAAPDLRQAIAARRQPTTEETPGPLA